MRAVVFHGIGDIRLENVDDPRIEAPTDAIVRITTSAICGTDLHFVRGTMGSMVPGTILGHEGVGIVEETGKAVRNLRPGDRVVIPSTITCGACVYCRAGYFAQCDDANPNGKLAGTAFYGGPKITGPFHGLQAELARIPYAHTSLVRLPEGMSDEQAILCSDIFPTGYFGADIAGMHDGVTTAVFGCGPVGQFAIASARHLGSSRVFAVDCVPSRLEMARRQGAEVIDFNHEDPVAVLRELTNGIGPDRAIDAVGVDAMRPAGGPARQKSKDREFDEELKKIAPETHPDHGNWQPGDGPSQAIEWAVNCLSKAGTLSVIGVYPPAADFFPLGSAMGKNLILRMGNCNHRKYIPRVLDLVRSGIVDPTAILTNVAPFEDAIEAYRSFDRREEGWIKVALRTETAMQSRAA
jgi:threonine dehydrogenase-like Zn-dependent dehydrogenase